MRIIVYSAVPLSKIWAKNFCLDRFVLEGCEVILLDASGIFSTGEQVAKYSSGSDDYLYDGNNLSVNNLYELESIVRKLNQTDIVWITCRFRFNNTFKNDDITIFHKYKIRYFTGHEYLIPQAKPNRLEYSSARHFLGKYLRYYASMYLQYIKNIPFKPVFVIGSGRAGREQAKIKVSQMGDYLSLPSLNILWNEVVPIKDEEYIVYVDEAAYHSPDVYILDGEKVVKSPEKFHSDMNMLFSKIKKWTGLPIVISASDKYHYKNNPFEECEIIYGKTKELIKYSQMVIGHKSAGLDQAIIDRKPVLQILNEEFINIKNRNITQSAKNNFNQEAVWWYKVDESILDQT